MGTAVPQEDLFPLLLSFPPCFVFPPIFIIPFLSSSFLLFSSSFSPVSVVLVATQKEAAGGEAGFREPRREQFCW